MSYAPLNRPGSYVPFLRLRGRWLKDGGFAIDRKVKVEVSEGRLTMVPVD
ncbi:MAG: SymE family type I addiction module toxin [Gammaproteobacteria bacterium]